MFARTAEKVVSSGENIHFRIIGNPLEYDFWYSEDGKYYEAGKFYCRVQLQKELCT